MALLDHVLRVETLVPGELERVFSFFSNPQNLELITPPELGFSIISPLPIIIQKGTLIDYRIRLLGVAFRWKTLISEWEPKQRFVDEQLKGPYAKWIHIHIFESKKDGVLIKDEVRYRLPLFQFGEIMFPVIRLQLKRIFEYRSLRINELIQSAS